jgi:hypothetical protein
VTVTPTTTSGAAVGEVGETGEVDVFFLQPTNNAVIPITSTLVMSATGVMLEREGQVEEGAGHLHLLVDTDFVPAGEIIPEDESHVHFGDGGIEREVVLAPGSHTLRLQFADGDHRTLAGDQYRDEIIVNVVDGTPEQAVRFVTPTDGATIPPTTTVIVAATGLTVEPSGEAHAGAGHLHLLVDEDFVRAGEMIPDDAPHMDFDGGQLTGTLSLEPGEHTLRLQAADGEHKALAGDQYRAEITVTVAEDAEDNRVMFVAPEDGAEVTAPFTITWAATGLIIEAAGPVVRLEGGHLHLLIDSDFTPGGEVIPGDANRLHFGKGQTSAQLSLARGEHTLRLQMADGIHIAKDGPQYQDEIKVTVK